MTMMAACYNLKRLTYFQKAGIEAFRRPKWAESPMPGAIRGKNGATPPRNTVASQRNRTELGRRHHCAMGFTEKLGLFEVPYGQYLKRLLRQEEGQ